MKRLSIKTSRILVTMLVILLPLTMSLSVSARVAVPLPEIPDESAEPVQPPAPGCSQAFSADGYRHPLQGISLKQTEELGRKETARVALDVVKRSDVSNVLKESGVKLNGKKVQAARHHLEGGNTLLAVSMSTKQHVLVYYELDQTVAELNPDGQGYRSIFKSEALLFAVDEPAQSAKLVSGSINGQLISRSTTASTQSLNCGNCTDMNNWTYAGATCASYNWGCVGGCMGTCGACAILCALGGLGNPGCWACLGWACPWCLLGCCNWEPACPWCGTP